MRLRLNATHLPPKPAKGGSLKLLGTLADDAVAAVTLSATRRTMSEAVKPAGMGKRPSLQKWGGGGSCPRRAAACPCWTTP